MRVYRRADEASRRCLRGNPAWAGMRSNTVLRAPKEGSGARCEAQWCSVVERYVGELFTRGRVEATGAPERNAGAGG